MTGDVTNRESGTTFDLLLGYNGCAGLNGGLTVNGIAQSSGANANFTYTLNGTLTSDRCMLDYTNLAVFVEGSSAMIDGLLDGDFEGTTVSCVYENVNAADQTALQNSCS